MSDEGYLLAIGIIEDHWYQTLQIDRSRRYSGDCTIL